ncbi:hypothetical protein HPB49_007318 [Dermacentor silvarum]|uniref:Uncharacterized protein n=1 Tax=Dermacentor silvarum TaxID=543639 RepID=A0ACB8C803_DERSI|nr:hypothetical protein HPB49_007318 [Dermacentor silvarum]
MKYCLVEFVDEKSIELVPATWVVGKYCFCPPGPGCQTAIKNCYEPRESRKYHIIIKGTFDNYEDGRRNLPMAEYSWDFDMEQELKKRKIHKLSRYVDQEMCNAPKSPHNFPGPSRSLGPGNTTRHLAASSLGQFQEPHEGSGSFVSRTAPSPRGGWWGESGGPALLEPRFPSPLSSPRPGKHHPTPRSVVTGRFISVTGLIWIVQQQQGELLTALTTRCTVKQSDNAPQVVVGQFDSYDELNKFDQTLTGPVREAVVRSCSASKGYLV